MKIQALIVGMFVVVLACMSACVSTDASPESPATVPIEQAIVGSWRHNTGSETNTEWRYHVYTEDGKYCSGRYLQSLVKEDAHCLGYELDGNTLTEICLEDSLGCDEGIMCQVEVSVREDGRLEYFVPERCHIYRSLPNDFFEEAKLFERVENPEES